MNSLVYINLIWFCCLFLLSVLRRLITLITQLSIELSNKAILKTQAENTNEAAKKFMEENERLKQVFKFAFLKCV